VNLLKAGKPIGICNPYINIFDYDDVVILIARYDKTSEVTEWKSFLYI